MRPIFFSWQSDSPADVNRYLIRDSLEAALKGLRVSAFLDEATRGVSGTPDIFATILSKIDKCAVFVADLTLAEMAAQRGFAPNPNVLIEYGYALAKVGDGRIIPVINTSFGPVEQLPFDLRHKVVRVSYSLPSEAQREVIKGLKLELTGRLRSELRLILEDPRSVLSLGDDELAVARFMLEKVTTGVERTYIGQDEVANGLGLDLTVAKRAIASLIGRDYLDRLEVIGTNAPPVTPTDLLLWDLDPFVNGWDSRSDARLLVQTLVETSDSGRGKLTTKKFSEERGWSLRRLNPALRYLMRHGFVNYSKTSVPDLATGMILETPATRKFLLSS